MVKTVQNLLYCGLVITCLVAVIEARPQSSLVDNNTQDTDTLEPQIEDARSAYYDLPAQYQGIPMDKLQMLINQYNRPAAYLRAPIFNGIDEFYRMPEAKRQVRYRQCYFNPISCFKK